MGTMKTEARHAAGSAGTRRAATLLLFGIFAGIAPFAAVLAAGRVAEKCLPAPEWTIPAELGPHAERMPFLQGGTDMGGGTCT